MLLLGLVSGCSLFSRRQPEPIADDATLQVEVKNALSQDPGFAGDQITVHSLNGVIDLNGTVKSVAAKARAGLVAASVRGVVQVHNDLLARTPATIYEQEQRR